MKNLHEVKQCLAEEFWTSREVLKFVKLIANKRRKSPYAILGWLFVEMLSRISYSTNYVTAVGKASLNMILLISGPTGGGKSVTRKIAKEVFDFDGLSISTPEPLQAGSGEAIADSFFEFRPEIDQDGKSHLVEDWVNLNHCRIFYNDEISYHKGKAHQNSSTLEATYLSSYSGDALGRVLAGNRGREVPAGQYRMITVFNSQPEHDPFRGEMVVASGLTSRLLNLSAVNPNARIEYETARSLPEPGKFKIPRLETRFDQLAPQYLALPEMEDAHAEEDFAAHEGTRALGESHTLLTRAKVSCVLAALEGRTYLISQDWHLAGHLIDHSNDLDQKIKEVLNKSERALAGKSGFVLGIKMGEAEESKHDHIIERVSQRLIKLAPLCDYDLKKSFRDESNAIALKALRQKISSRDREYIEEALNKLRNTNSE
jgi:hypothetical protein